MSIGQMVRGGLWLYIGGLFSSFLGILYWIVASRLLNPSTVGSASAILAFQGILLTLLSLGLPTGIKRFIGHAEGNKEYNQLSAYFSTSLVLLGILYLPVIFIVLFFSLLNLNFLNLNSIESFFLAIILLLGFLPPLFNALFNSLLRTRISAISQMVSSIVRITVGILLLFLGLEFIGLMLGFVFALLTIDILLVAYTLKLYRGLNIKFSLQLSLAKEIIQSGLPAWLPSFLTIIGQSLGVLIIYAVIGSVQTGQYYIAFTLASIVITLIVSIQTLLFPVLSGMEEGRQQIASRVTRLTLSIATPLALILSVYPLLPLSLLGPSYFSAAPAVQILAFGAVFYPIFSVYYSYIYALGKYAHVTAIGLAMNLARIVLYPFLITILGFVGAAITYSTGIFIGLIPIFLSAYTIGYKFEWRKIGIAILLPFTVALFLFFFGVHAFIGIPLLLVFCLVVYTRFRIITKNDLNEISRAFFSEKSLTRMYLLTRPLIRILYSE